MRDCRKVILFSLLIATAAMLVGCARDDGAAAKREPVRVLTTVYALADLVRQIGGDRVYVEWFVEEGQSLEALAETPDRRAQLNSVDLIVTRGAMDPWTLRGAGNEFNDRRILRIDTLASTRDTDPDLYMWLDPQVGVELCDELAARLAAERPENEKMFKANAAELRKKIVDMTEAARAPLDASNGAFITIDPGFNSLARRMGLEEVRLPAIRVDDPTAYGARVIKETAEVYGARAIFANSRTPPALVRDWEARLKLAVLPLDALGSSALTGRSTYLAILEYNLKQLQEGMALAKPRQRKVPEVAPLGVVIESKPEFEVPTTAEASLTPEPEIEVPREYRRLGLPGPSTRSITTSPFNPIPAPEKKPIK